MSKQVRIWEVIENRNVRELSKSKLDLEKRLEDWLNEDISIISGDLLTIGRQVKTDFGGVIDLLCLDGEGNVVIVELKKDKTPREITAQVLDYASWVRDLSRDKIVDISREFFKIDSTIEEIFREKFDEEIPEVLNNHHRMLIVASEIDESSERIINYLSDTHSVDINAVTFEYFKDGDGHEFIANVFLIEPEIVDIKAKRVSGRTPKLTYEELSRIAAEKKVGDIYEYLLIELKEIFETTGRRRSGIAFNGRIKGSNNVLISLLPPESSIEKGLKFQAYSYRLSWYFNKNLDEIIAALPQNKKPWAYAPTYDSAQETYKGFDGFITDLKEAERLVLRLKALEGNAG